MSTRTTSLAALAIVALIGVGCSNEPAENGNAGNTDAANREKAVKFAECMRENGVTQFPDPTGSGELTADEVVRTCSRRGSQVLKKGAPSSSRRASSSPSAYANTACRTFRTPPMVSPSSTRIESHPLQRTVV